MSIRRNAPTWAAWARGNRNVPGPLQGASLAGLPFLPDVLGPNARFSVEVAWGSDVDSDVMNWSDITGDVYVNPGTNFTYGRGEEASTTQPARASLTLDNTGAKYSIGPQSPNYPNVKLGLPIRFRVNLPGTGFTDLFYGNVTKLKPEWADQSAKVAVVRLEAAGILKRLLSTDKTVISTARRAYSDETNIVAYWTCEVGRDALYLDSAVPDAPAMVFVSGSPSLGSNTDFAGSNPLPVINTSAWRGEIPAYTDTGVFHYRALAEFQVGAEYPDGAVIHRLWATGSVAQWDIVYKTGGSLVIVAYDHSGVALSTTPVLVFNLLDYPKQRRISLVITQVGPDVQFQPGIANVYPINGSAFLAAEASPTTIPGQTMGSFYTVEVNPYAQPGFMVVGHIIAENAKINIFTDASAMGGNPSETGTARFRRLADENGIPFTQYPNPPSAIQFSTRMGAQRPGTVVGLLREVEMADQGVMFDGPSNKLIYVSADYKDNRPALFTIDAAAFELSPPFEPVHDDQRAVNLATVTRKEGVASTYEDTDGPFGTAAMGNYTRSESINLHQDSQAVQYASWFVHLGTHPGYRYPTVTLDIGQNPRFAPYVAGLLPGSRIDEVNIGTALPDQAHDSVSLVVEGVSQLITSTQWIVTLQCSPFDLWRIIVLAADTGDTSEFICHLDTDNSILIGGADVGATSLNVQTVSGPVWTTTADDFPFDVSVGGVKATVTNITGVASPQTFTIQPLSMARPDQSEIKVWNPPVLRIG